MKNNTAILDCLKKTILFCFNNETFTIDLTEGDLPDSWNSIVDKNNVVWDVNFSWEDEVGEKPYFSVYGLTEFNGEWSTDTNEQTSIKITKKVGTRADYFKDERPKYVEKKKRKAKNKKPVFDSSLPMTLELFDAKGKSIFKSKSGNDICDAMTLETFRGQESYIIATDSNGSTKRMESSPSLKNDYLKVKKTKKK